MNTLRNYLKKFFPINSSNLKVVVLCVITATTFWILNALNKDDYSTIVNQPIEFYFDNEEYMPVQELPSSVSIEIYGNGWDLLRKYFRFNVNPYVLAIDDPSKQNYIPTRNFEKDLAEKISPTHLVDILEDTIYYRIDKVVSRKINIELDTTSNTLSTNFRYAGDINIDPPSITVKGPISVIQELDGKIRLDLAEENINKNFSKLLPVILPRDMRPYLTLEEETVHVSFEVVEFLEGSRKLRVKKLYFPSQVDIEEEDPSVVINFLVDERRLEDLKSLELEAILNYNNRNQEDSTVSVTLNVYPTYLESITLEPDKFKLIYE